MRIDALLLALDRILAKQTHAARWEALALAADAQQLIELRETHAGPTPELTKLRELLDPVIDTLAMGKGSYVLPLAKEKLVQGLERLVGVVEAASEIVTPPEAPKTLEIHISDTIHVEDEITAAQIEAIMPAMNFVVGPRPSPEMHRQLAAGLLKDLAAMAQRDRSSAPR